MLPERTLSHSDPHAPGCAAKRAVTPMALSTPSCVGDKGQGKDGRVRHSCGRHLEGTVCMALVGLGTYAHH